MPGNPSCVADWTITADKEGCVVHRFQLHVSGLRSRMPSTEANAIRIEFAAGRLLPTKIITKIGDQEEADTNMFGLKYELPLRKVYKGLNKQAAGDVAIELHYQRGTKKIGNLEYLEVDGITPKLLSSAGIGLAVTLPEINDWRVRVLEFVARIERGVLDRQSVSVYEIHPVYLHPRNHSVKGVVTYDRLRDAPNHPIEFSLGYKPLGLLGMVVQTMKLLWEIVHRFFGG